MVWRVSMIYRSKVILFATQGNNPTSHLSQGAPLGDQGNYFLATLTPSTIFLSVELLPPNQTTSFVLPSLSMCLVSQLEMFQHVIPWVGLVIIRMIHPCRHVSLCWPHVGWRSWKRGCQDQRMLRINNFMRCNLDHEDCAGLVPPLSSYLLSQRSSGLRRAME